MWEKIAFSVGYIRLPFWPGLLAIDMRETHLMKKMLYLKWPKIGPLSNKEWWYHVSDQSIWFLVSALYWKVCPFVFVSCLVQDIRFCLVFHHWLNIHSKWQQNKPHGTLVDPGNKISDLLDTFRDLNNHVGIFSIASTHCLTPQMYILTPRLTF